MRYKPNTFTGKIIKALLAGETLSQKAGYDLFGKTCTTQRISELINKDGLPIEREMVYQGNNVKYASYYIKPQNRQKVRQLLGIQ